MLGYKRRQVRSNVIIRDKLECGEGRGRTLKAEERRNAKDGLSSTFFPPPRTFCLLQFLLCRSSANNPSTQDDSNHK